MAQHIPQVQLAPGADLTADPATWTWVDLSASQRVLGTVTSTIGRPDEGQAQPSRLTMRLDNTDGALTRADGPWGQLPRHTPVRLRVDPGTGTYADRAYGYLDDMQLSWPAGAYGPCWADVTAAGVTRRLGQGVDAPQSTMRRSIPAVTRPWVWWPCEDAAGSTQIMEAYGGPPMTWGGATPALGASSSPGCAGAATLGSDTVMVGPVPTYSGATSYMLEAAVLIPSQPALATPILQWYSNGSPLQWRITLFPGSPDKVGLEAWTTTGSYVVGSFQFSWPSSWYGQTVAFEVEVRQNGGNLEYQIWAATNTGTGQVGGSVAGTLGTITNIQVPGWDHSGWQYSHIALWTTTLAPWGTPGGHGLALLAHVGEKPIDRLVRIAGYASVPIGVTSVPAGPVMGAEPVADPVTILREAEAADGGLLIDGQTAGLVHVCGQDRRNRAIGLTLDASQVRGAFGGAVDDLRLRNAWAVNRTGGATARAVDSASIAASGYYPDAATLNLQYDTDLSDQAGWRVHLGVVGGVVRITAISFDLVADPSLRTAWLAMRPGYRIRVVHPPPQLTSDPIDLVVMGWIEVVDAVTWRITANTIDYTPWQVLAIEDAVLGRLDTAGMTLTAGITATATTIQLTTTTGPTCSTSSGDYPVDIGIGGERITLTGPPSGSTSPQTFTGVIRSANGIVKAQAAGAAAALWTAPVPAPA